MDDVGEAVGDGVDWLSNLVPMINDSTEVKFVLAVAAILTAYFMVFGLPAVGRGVRNIVAVRKQRGRL